MTLQKNCVSVINKVVCLNYEDSLGEMNRCVFAMKDVLLAHMRESEGKHLVSFRLRNGETIPYCEIAECYRDDIVQSFAEAVQSL